MEPRIDYRRHGQEALKSLWSWKNTSPTAAWITTDSLAEDARFADQRLRLLHRYAFDQIEGLARPSSGFTSWMLARGAVYTERERAALAWTERSPTWRRPHVPMTFIG